MEISRATIAATAPVTTIKQKSRATASTTTLKATITTTQTPDATGMTARARNIINSGNNSNKKTTLF